MKNNKEIYNKLIAKKKSHNAIVGDKIYKRGIQTFIGGDIGNTRHFQVFLKEANVGNK